MPPKKPTRPPRKTPSQTRKAPVRKPAAKKKTVPSKNRKRSKKPNKKSLFSFKSIFSFLFTASIWGAIAGFLLLVIFSYDLPNISEFTTSMKRPAVIIKARDGSILATYGDLTGRTVDVKQLPKHVPGAILAVEDARFYDHFGVDPIGIFRAVLRNFSAGRVVQGGSTITQQLAKNFLMSEGVYSFKDRSFRRKIQELILAVQLERKFTKDQILSIYLNRVYLGSGTYGISAAAAKYFGKDPKDLSIYEAAVIAGLLKAPSRYSPQNSTELADRRAQIVLARMEETDRITPELRESLRDGHANLKKVRKSNTLGLYFCDWVTDQAQQYLGGSKEDIVIHTTLDIRLQSLADQAVNQVIAEKSEAHKVTQGALLAMTPSGAIRAMVGGQDYRKSQFNRATQAERQAGSVFKLFVYVAALEREYRRTDFISDEEVVAQNWRPANFAWTTRGEVSLQDAFAYSVNTPAVRLTQEVGQRAVRETAERLGIRTDQPLDLTISLGSGSTTLLDMTTAYAVIANHGYRVEPFGILSVKGRSGKTYYKHTDSYNYRIVDKRVTHEMTDMLRSVMDYGTGRSLSIGRPAAGKSGTTQNYKDAWFVGFTPDLIAGAWMGNDDATPMEKGTGSRLAGQIWKRFMASAHRGFPAKDFPSI